MPAPSYLSDYLHLHHTAATTTRTSTSAHLLSGGRNRSSRPRHISGIVLLKAKAGDGDVDVDGGDELLLASRRHTRAVALIRVLHHVPAGSVLGVARVLFAAANERCLRGMNQAAPPGRGSLFVGAMADSWRVLMQGLASLVFLCARADEYVRQPPSPLVLTAHDKPAAHPQQRRCWQLIYRSFSNHNSSQEFGGRSVLARSTLFYPPILCFLFVYRPIILLFAKNIDR